MGTFSNKVVGIFQDRAAVDSLLYDLNSMGYDKGDISVLAKDHDPARNSDYEKTYFVNSVGAVHRVNNVEDLIRNPNNDTVVTVKEKDLIKDNNFDEKHEVTDKDPASMVKGAATGGAIGLLAGIGLLLVPGIGPVLAAGPIIAALTAGAAGAAVGATAGTLIGLLKDEGIPHDRAEFYTNHFNNGDVLVVVGPDEDKKGQLREIFTKYKASTVDSF